MGRRGRGHHPKVKGRCTDGMGAREDRGERELARDLTCLTSLPYPRVAKARTRREEEYPKPFSPFR